MVAGGAALQQVVGHSETLRHRHQLTRGAAGVGVVVTWGERGHILEIYFLQFRQFNYFLTLSRTEQKVNKRAQRALERSPESEDF